MSRCLLALAFALALELSGCATLHRAEETVLAADPAPDAGFLAHPEQLTPDPERAPFDRMWTSSAPRGWRGFPKLFVAPVDTGHVSELTLWEKLTLLRPSEVKLDTVVMAVELRNRLEAAFRDDPGTLVTAIRPRRATWEWTPYG
jgi:hypothetical protein